MELSINDVRESLCSEKSSSSTEGKNDNHGYCIAVLDNGFVYVGDVRTDANYIYIKNTKNIRKWTGNNGLSWYAINGFRKDITLDISGDVMAPYNELKHLITCSHRA